jgi:hypothetical protein
LSFACRKLCGKNLKRPHFSCLACRLRRLAYGKLDKKKYRFDKQTGLVVPNVNFSVYMLIIDGNRRFAKVKGLLLKKVLAIAEFLAC